MSDASASDLDLELSSIDGSHDEKDAVDTSGDDSDAEEDIAFNPVMTADEGGTSNEPKTVQEKLQEVVDEIEEGREVDIQRLLAEGADVNYQYGEDLKTPLHLLCDSFGLVKEDRDYFEPFAAMARTLLDAGANVNIVDSDGNIVLHAAADGGAPAEVLKEIIKRTEDVSKSNQSGYQALHRLFQSSGTITHESLEVFIDTGADLEAKGSGRAFTDSPLQGLASKKDCVSLMSTIDHLKPGLLDQHLSSMLRPAVKDGTFKTVKTLLNRGASIDVEGNGDPLILVAAESSEEAFKKFNCLVAAGCDIHAVDNNGKNVFHKAAGVDNIEVIREGTWHEG